MEQSELLSSQLWSQPDLPRRWTELDMISIDFPTHQTNVETQGLGASGIWQFGAYQRSLVPQRSLVRLKRCSSDKSDTKTTSMAVVASGY